MAARFVTVDRETRLLLPPDMRQWVPENHLSQFILDAVDEMDRSAAKVNHRGCGSEQYPPDMLLSLLIYSYSSGVFSSRSIERATYDSVATRVLCGDTHPDHDTICAFRGSPKSRNDRQNKKITHRRILLLVFQSDRLLGSDFHHQFHA